MCYFLCVIVIVLFFYLNIILFSLFTVNFKCNGGPPAPESQTETSFVDPMTGVRVVEVQMEVERSVVEGVADFDETGYECQCMAWSSRGLTPSKTAKVATACKYSRCDWAMTGGRRRAKL